MVAATPIGARVATPKLTDVELYAWIAQAEAGARIEYHRGFLGIDVTPVSGAPCVRYTLTSALP